MELPRERHLPIGDLPAWLDTIGWLFPLKPLANGVAAASNPTVAGLGWHAGYLASLAAWLVIGVVVAARFFRWQPATGGDKRPKRRASTTS